MYKSFLRVFLHHKLNLLTKFQIPIPKGRYLEQLSGKKLEKSLIPNTVVTK